MKLLILLLFPMIIGCEKKQNKVVVVDFNRAFILKEGDSILWQEPIFVIDSIDTTGSIDFTAGHSLPQDTLIGLKNYKPFILILGTDTTKHYWGDTLRIQKCEP